MDKESVDKNKIFETISGSHSHGTNTKDSDIDIRGLYIADKSLHVGFLADPKLYQGGKDEDVVIYELKKYFELASKANPSMLEYMWTREEDWRMSTKYWEKMVENRAHFISSRVRHTFGSYAAHQFKRLKSHRNFLLNPAKAPPKRSDFGLPEDRSLLTKDHSHAFLQLVNLYIQGRFEYIELHEDISDRIKEVDFIGIMLSEGITDEKIPVIQNITGATDEFMSALQKEKAYHNARQGWKSYLNWKETRNPKRAALEAKFGMDTKHLYHVIRLLRMCMEVLETGEMHVYRPDREELISIREGGMSYDEAEEYFAKTKDKIVGLYETTKLPKKPDLELLNNLWLEIAEEFWVAQ